MNQLRVGIIGATGMVGQRLVALLETHPYFKVSVLGAGDSSAGKTYGESTAKKWKLDTPMPDYAKHLQVYHGQKDISEIKKQADMVFCAVQLPKADIVALEEAYAKAEMPVVSNNSANRLTPDVPMLIPEINSAHLSLIDRQKERLGTKRGFIVTKPNCSIQSYVPPLTPLRKFGIRQVAVATYQAVSGAGKTLADMPQIIDNLIPYIEGEEEKSQQEPLKIWGRATENGVIPAASPQITAQCLRVPVSDGHTAAVFVSFENPPTKAEILSLWERGEGFENISDLPSAPARFVTYTHLPDRPQPSLDRLQDKGMGVTVGRLREDTVFDYKFVALSHNTLRGAAGGALLTAEYLYSRGYLER